MSIGVGFILKSKKNILGTKKIEMNKLKTELEELKSNFEYTYQLQQEKIYCEFCEEGFCWLEVSEKEIKGDCQTNIAGPGFHAYVIDFIENLAEKMGLNLVIEDETKYYKTKDFETMRKEYFYSWLNTLTHAIYEEQQKKLTNICMCWPLDFYLPKDMEGTVVCPSRRFDIKEIERVVQGEAPYTSIEEFAKDFFLWNQKEKDAYFYRNSAVVNLNKNCYFMPSSRSDEDQIINARIIMLLEKSLDLDTHIPFPKSCYLEVCQLDNHNPKELEQIRELETIHELGYRKDIVSYTLGNIHFYLPGNFLQEQEDGGTILYYDSNTSDWRNCRMSAFACKEAAQFDVNDFKEYSVESLYEFDVDQGKCMAGIKKVEDEDETYYMLNAEVIFKKQCTVITLCYKNEMDKQWAFETLRKINTIGE